MRTVFISITEAVFIAPEKTSFPSNTSSGTDSPVSAELSMKVFPFVIIPSTGIRSPGFTTTVSPVLTSPAPTVTVFPLRMTSAVSGRMFISA